MESWVLSWLYFALLMGELCVQQALGQRITQQLRLAAESLVFTRPGANDRRLKSKSAGRGEELIVCVIRCRRLAIGDRYEGDVFGVNVAVHSREIVIMLC